VTWVLSIVVFACFACGAPDAWAASFDCAKASTQVEKTVCSDSELSRLDEALDHAYAELKGLGRRVDELRKEQFQWLSVRNACASHGCIRTAYVERLETLELSAPLAKKSFNDLGWKPGYQRFRLLRGGDAEVCRAHVAMLRGTFFNLPPYCGRSEPHGVPGFEPLNRVHLDVESIAAIHSAMPQFEAGELDPQQYRTIPTDGDRRYAQLARSLALDSAPSAFDPAIDIDNDGGPDRIVYWPIVGRECGKDSPINKDGSLLRGPRHGLALDVHGGIDVARTRELFGHRNPRAITINDAETGTTKAIEVRAYWPITSKITFTKYRGKYYFDGPLDPYRDLEKERKRAPTRDGRADYQLSQSEALLFDTIGVYERRNAKTIQHCQIRWSAPETAQQKRKIQ
jgi:uncharacterized protein YecT (DUF1311 family)